MVKDSLGVKLRALRKKAGMSQHDLADRSGISFGAIQKIESDGNTSLETLRPIASALNTTLSELLDEGDRQVGNRALFDVSDLLNRIANLQPVHRAVILYLIYKDKRILEDLSERISGTRLQDVQSLLKAL